MGQFPSRPYLAHFLSYIFQFSFTNLEIMHFHDLVEEAYRVNIDII